MSKFIEDAVVVSNKFIAEKFFLLRVKAPQIARAALPGQFCEIKTSETAAPLLRRPFSISNVENDEIEFMIDVVGVGTEILSRKKTGDVVNILGPLGKGFNYTGDFDTAFLLAGGAGVAPFPFLYQKLVEEEKDILAVAGFSSEGKIPENITNKFLIATDDGSVGFHGTAVELAEKILNERKSSKIKAFACGPVPMLKAAKNFFAEKEIELEISVESAMACGIGLCQGCAIEKADVQGYFLICKDGPVFNSKEVIL
jgi:dihydroorotate dehydrogenase electron transfer subunit